MSSVDTQTHSEDNKMSVASAVEVERSADAAIRRLQARVWRLEQRTHDLEMALEERQVIEKAKGILMERLGLSEVDAMRRLQRESGARNLTPAELAQRIVQAGEMV